MEGEAGMAAVGAGGGVSRRCRPVAAGLLGRVECAVCVLQQGLGGFVRAPLRDAGAETHVHALAVV